MLVFLLSTMALAEEFVWVEGEDTTSSNFQDHGWFNNVNQDLLSPGIPGVLDGEWHIHYNSGSADPAQASYVFEVSEGGEYELWLRVLTPLTKNWISIDSGNQIDLEVDWHIREPVNLIWPSPYDFANWCQTGDYCNIHHTIAWVKADNVTLSPGQHSLTFGAEQSDSWAGVVGGLDAFVLFNFDWAPSGANQPVLPETQPAADQWFPFHPNDPPEDWSTSAFAVNLEKPAGQRGFVTRQGGDFVFTDGTVQKFWGIGAHPPATVAQMERQAALLSSMGVNLVRLHSLESLLGNPIDPDELDKMDQWFSILKEHGIYYQWSIFYPHNILSSDGYALFDELNDGSTSGLATVFPELQDLEWAYLEELLNHVNPYTGMTYVDDPALAIVEVRNEDSIFWHNPLTGLESNYPQHAAILKADWAAWLATLYADDAALAAAWGAGLRSDDSLSNDAMKIYEAWEMTEAGPYFNADEALRMGDWIRFLAERQRDGYKNRIDNLRAAGFQGVTTTTAWYAGGRAADLAHLWTDDEADAIDRHAYDGGVCLVDGQDCRTVWGGVIVSGQVRNTSALLEPGTGILNRFKYQMEDKPMLFSEWVTSAPAQHKMESLPMFALYGMGLHGWDASLNFAMQKSSSFVSGWPSLSFWTANTPHHLGQYPALSRAVLEGHLQEGSPALTQRYTEEDIYAGVDRQVSFDPWLGAVGPLVNSFDGGTTESVDLADYRDGDVVRSNTDELHWSSQGWFHVTTDKTQGVVGLAGPATIQLPAVDVDLQTSRVSLLFTSLDTQPLQESTRILVTAMGQDKQTGAIYNSDGTELISIGGPPLLLEPVQATLTFSGDPIVGVNILNEYGVVVGTVDDVNGNTVTIDGRWKTLWYEVLREGWEDHTDTTTDTSTDTENTDTATDTESDTEGTTSGNDEADEADDNASVPIKNDDGCGCASANSSSSWFWLLALGGLVWRRRNAK